jgi:hypothetical protein
LNISNSSPEQISSPPCRKAELLAPDSIAVTFPPAYIVHATLITALPKASS